MPLTPTVDTLLKVKNKVDGSVLCELLYPANQFTTEEALRVLNGEAYPPIDLIRQPETIVDVGACCGDSTLFFASIYPKAHVYAFEPTPESFVYLEKNAEQFKDRIHAHPVALIGGSADGEIPLYVGADNTGGVCNSLAYSPESTPIMVPCIGAAKMFRQLGISKIDILKVDAEGAERVIFPDLIDYLPFIPVIYAEYHTDDCRRLIDHCLPGHVLAKARAHNHECGELVYVKLSTVNTKLVPRW